MTLYMNINSIKMKTVGAVVFIHLLLLIAGVEPNPGPTDTLVFRYQYLLIEVGTKLLRKLFDAEVGYDLMKHLSTYDRHDKRLKFLLVKNILTDDQKELLPPLDNNPNTAKYDMTLLTCLLLNICNLKYHLRSEITRLRQCRNFVAHKVTVHISESELKVKWFELCQILYRLNNFCGVPNLPEMVMDAKSKALDGQLKQRYDNVLKARNEAESLLTNEIDQIKIHQSEIKDEVLKLKDTQEQTTRKLANIEPTCSSNKRTKLCSNDDIKELLIQSYEKHFRTVCVTPLCIEDYRMDMLTVYSRSEMEHVPYHITRKSEGNYEIASYEQVFSNENTFFRNIFITGDAGMGKTYFGQLMSLLWSKAIAGDIVGNIETQKDATFMTNFDFLFYISLKETSSKDVVSMIVDKYFFTSSNDKYEETIKTIEELLQTKKCLVILDGLDEWRPDTGGHRNLSLPIKVTSDKCTYLTTCRPHIIETVRLSENDIDQQVQIKGFDYERYIEKVVCYINELQNSNKDRGDFMKQIRESRMVDQLRIPVLTSQLIVVWINEENVISNMNRAMIYSSIVDMLFARAKKNKIEFPSMTSSDVHLPKPFSRFKQLQKHVCTLEKVCLLSFLLLFDPDNKTPSLVFTNDQLSDSYNISPDEIDFLCQLGIISKNKVIAPYAEEQHMLSFLHASYLEFLAALFVSLFAKTDFFRESVKKICINNVSKYENFLILLSGISFHMTRIFFEIIYEKDEWDLFRRNCFFAFVINGNFQSPYDMQNITLSCLKEICVSDNSQRFIKLEDFRFEYLFEHQQNLKKLLNKNKHNVKSLKTACYREEFNEVKCLQYLIIDMKFDVRFNKFMLQNQATLHSLILHNCYLSSDIPVRSLPCLTSIRFERLTIKHDLMHYISGNILLENIVLHDVQCKEHNSWLNKCCQFSLNLSKHSKLLQMDLDDTNIECSRIKNSCLLSLRLKGRSYSGRCPGLTHVVDIIQNSKLEYLNLDTDCIHHAEINHVINALSSLKYIKSVELFGFTLPDSVPLQIHPDIVCDEYIYIKLNHVTMSDKSFQDFIDCVVHHQSVVRVCIDDFDASRSIFNLWKWRVQKLQANKFVRMLNKFGNDYFTYNVVYVNGDNADDIGVVDDYNDDRQDDVGDVDDYNDDRQDDIGVVDDYNDDRQDDIGVVDDYYDDRQDDIGVVDDYNDDRQDDIGVVDDYNDDRQDDIGVVDDYNDDRQDDIGVVDDYYDDRQDDYYDDRQDDVGDVDDYYDDRQDDYYDDRQDDIGDVDDYYDDRQDDVGDVDDYYDDRQDDIGVVDDYYDDRQDDYYDDRQDDVGDVDDYYDDGQDDVGDVDDYYDDGQNDYYDDRQDDVGVVDDYYDDGQDDIGVVDDYYDDGQNDYYDDGQDDYYDAGQDDVVNCFFKVKFEFETIK